MRRDADDSEPSYELLYHARRGLEKKTVSGADSKSPISRKKKICHEMKVDEI